MTKHKKKKKNRCLKIFLIVLLSLLLLFVGGAVGVWAYLFGGLNTEELDKTDEELGVNEELANTGIVNIALFGVDTGAEGQTAGTRSDAIIILTIDEKNSAVKMTSILRDSKVPIEGIGEKNINQAYDIGGPTLAIKTLNQNFDLDIREYVTVDFSQLAAIVDAVGGVTVTIYPPEIKYINDTLKAYYPDEPMLQHSGEVILTGPQALAYSRIRGMDSDTIRAARQHHVLDSLLQKIQKMPKSDYPAFIRKIMGMVETSLSYSDLIGLSSFAVNGFTIEENTIPLPDYETDLWGGVDENNWWVWTYDIGHATERLHHIIYGTPYDDPTTPDVDESVSSESGEAVTADESSEVPANAEAESETNQ